MLSRQASFLVALVAPAFALALGVTPSAAQQAPAQELSILELSRKGSVIRNWVANPSSDPAERAEYEQYFDRFYFPMMKQNDPAALGELADMRVRLFRDYIERATPEIQQELTQKAYDFANEVIRGRYVRPVKVNALLILGQLDEQYAQRGQQAKPLPRATIELCKYVYWSATRERNVPAYIHVAAMAGLERHAALYAQLDARGKSALGQTLLKAVAQQQFPAGTDAEVRDWMRMQAARAVAAIGNPGPNGVFVDALQKLISDDTVDLRTRVDAAALLARLRPEPDTVPEAVAQRTVGALKNLACDVAKAEKESALEFEELHAPRQRRMTTPFYEHDRIRRASGNISGGMRGRGLGVGGGWEYVRRGLIAQLEQLRTGLRAGANVAGDDAATLRSISAALESTVDVAGESNTDFDVVDSVKEMAREVDELAGCNAPPPGDEEQAEADLLAPPDEAAPAEGE